jgi:hypothetical protein
MKKFIIIIVCLFTVAVTFAQAKADVSSKTNKDSSKTLKEPQKEEPKEPIKKLFDTTTINGCMGLIFGQSKSKVKQIMTSKGGILDTKYSKPDVLIYDNIKFATRKTSFVACHFTNDKLCECVIYMKADLESNTTNLYNVIKNELNKKYYESDVTFEQYKYPYEKGDGFTENAISLGKATFITYWFENSSEQFGENINFVILEITSDMYIKILYQDAELSKGAKDKEVQEKNLDY